ncbi:MAG: nucleotidyl transferase AbiEii/AbiGii toxin family protein [Nitrospirota bacterium]
MNRLKGKGILTSIQKNLLIELGKIQEISLFYLTGGTALAEFYFGHRRSYDLDFFTGEKEIIIPVTQIIEDKLHQKHYTVTVIRRFETFAEIEAHNKDGEDMRLHLAYDSPFRFEEPYLSDFGIKVNDYPDLIIDKFLTFFGRWKHRDAIDLFFILRTESVANLIKMAKEKDPGFDLYWFCMALKEVDEFPDDIAKWPVDMLVEIDVVELKNKFLGLAREIMNEIKEGGNERRKEIEY